MYIVQADGVMGKARVFMYLVCLLQDYSTYVPFSACFYRSIFLLMNGCTNLSCHQYSFQFWRLLLANTSHRHLSSTNAYAIKGNFSSASHRRWFIVAFDPTVTDVKFRACICVGDVNCTAAMSEIASWYATNELFNCNSIFIHFKQPNRFGKLQVRCIWRW